MIYRNFKIRSMCDDIVKSFILCDRCSDYTYPVDDGDKFFSDIEVAEV